MYNARTLGEVSGPVLNHEHNCFSGMRTGLDSHGICRQLRYPSVDFLGSKSAAAVLIVWRRRT